MGIIQGLDTIPKEIQRDFFEIFKDRLPGWSGAGEYNFRPGAVTQMASAQLGVLMQNGSHPWINNQLRALLEDPEFTNLLPDEKTKRLAALVNFMSEAHNPEALASGGAKTGGYIAFSSRSDPNLIAKLNYQPTTAQMKLLTEQGLSWSNILGSQAGQEVLALNPRAVNGVLEFDGKLSNGGFFSKNWNEIGSWKTYSGIVRSSTQYSHQWATDNKITVVRNAVGIADGSVLKDGVAVSRCRGGARRREEVAGNHDADAWWGEHFEFCAPIAQAVGKNCQASLGGNSVAHGFYG